MPKKYAASVHTYLKKYTIKVTLLACKGRTRIYFPSVVVQVGRQTTPYTTYTDKGMPCINNPIFLRQHVYFFVKTIIKQQWSHAFRGSKERNRVIRSVSSELKLFGKRIYARNNTLDSLI